MSFFYYDGSIIPRMELNKATSTYSRFTKYWTTLTMQNADGDDVLVYSPNSRVFYLNGYIVDETTKRFVKGIGINWDEFISTSVDGEIVARFFTLRADFPYSGERAFADKTFATAQLVEPSIDDIKESFDKQFIKGDIVDVTIGYGGQLKRYINEHELEWEATGTGIHTKPLNSSEIRSVLASNPWYYYANSRHIPYSKNSNPFNTYTGNNAIEATSWSGTNTPRTVPVCSVATSIGSLGVMALLDNGTMFEPILTATGEVRVINEVLLTDSTGKAGEVLEYTYTLSFKYLGTTSNYLPGQVLNWYDHYYQDMADIPKVFMESDRYGEAKTTSTIDTKIKSEMRELMVDPTLTGGIVEDSMYLKIPRQMIDHVRDGDPDNPTVKYKTVYTKYLKVNSVAAMKKREFVKMLSSSIGTDHVLEEKDWYENLLAIVIVIVAIVVAYFTAGMAIGVIAKMALFAGTLAIGLSIGGMILSEVGGMTSAGNVKVMGKFATIIGYVGSILGIFAFLQAFAQNAFKEAAKESLKEAGKELTKEAIIAEAGKQLAEASVSKVLSAVVDSALKSVTSIFTEAATASLTQNVNTVMDGLSGVMKGLDFYMDREQDKYEQELGDLKAASDKYDEEILNKPYIQTAGVFMITHEKLAAPDMLQDLAADIDSRVGHDKSALAFQTCVDS